MAHLPVGADHFAALRSALRAKGAVPSQGDNEKNPQGKGGDKGFSVGLKVFLETWRFFFKISFFYRLFYGCLMLFLKLRFFCFFFSGFSGFLLLSAVFPGVCFSSFPSSCRL